MPAAYVGAAMAVGQGINSMTQDGGHNYNAQGTYGGQPGTYIPTNQGNIDLSYNHIIDSQMPYATALPGQMIPLYNDYLSRVQNNPYAAQALNSVGQAYGNANNEVAPDQFGGMRSLYDLGRAAMPYATQMLTSGFDPQSALYDRNLNNLTQQLAAANARNGLTGPAAAAIDAQALSNFNLDWQDRALGRQVQATQGYGNLTRTAAGAFAGASDLGTAGINTVVRAGQLPYATYMGQQNDLLAALNGYSSGYANTLAPGNQVISNLLPYMRLGQNASALAQQGQSNDFMQSQALGQGFGQSLAGLKDSGLGRYMDRTVNDWFSPTADADQFQGYGYTGGSWTLPS